ncbi:MAG: DNA/RNA helicase domain-containing protein [Thiobacillus sp.]
MTRAYYFKSISEYMADSENFVLGELARKHEFALEEQQRNAWLTQIRATKKWLAGTDGHIAYEYSIPRMGKRIDCVIISGAVIFAIEFKVGATVFERHAIDQVMDYALDLKNFHERSHQRIVVPVLVCTAAEEPVYALSLYDDRVAKPICTNGNSLATIIAQFPRANQDNDIDANAWLASVYKPTPTIIEAAQALYRGHSVEEISRSDAGKINLSRTAKAISDIIDSSKQKRQKSICFLTGVPGAGKTLAGLNLANSWHNVGGSEHAVFLSGNGPLVDVLREALARNEVAVAKENGRQLRKGMTLSKAKAFIQNIHHFRDDALATTAAPIERVVVFDEAQRAWSQKQTASFMKTKKAKSILINLSPSF